MPGVGYIQRRKVYFKKKKKTKQEFGSLESSCCDVIFLKKQAKNVRGKM